MADLAGLGRLQVRDIESGGNQLSTFEPMRALAIVFNVWVEELDDYLQGRIDLETFNRLGERGRTPQRVADAIPSDIALQNFRKQLETLTRRLTIQEEYVTLLSEPQTTEGLCMDGLPRAARRAVLAIVYSKGHELGAVTRRAKEVHEAFGDFTEVVDAWVALILEGLPDRPTSTVTMTAVEPHAASVANLSERPKPAKRSKT